ncbi:MAG: phosphatase PAP2 family protein [Bacteroidales bacterium]|nr:phosphatase PAP2 family protein [Bacteroidales bacterium]
MFLILNGLHTPFWDGVMEFASGKLTWFPLYIVLLLLLWRKCGRQVIWWLLAVAVVVLLVDQISSSLIKPTVERLRPTHNPEIAHLVHIVNGYRGGLYGFVSSHAGNTFGVAVLLALVLGNRWGWIGLMQWAALVSYSRIYLGVHYPGDVLCGALLGVAVAVSVYQIARRFIFRYQYKF